MKKNIFRGSATAIVTPMDKKGCIDFDALKKILDFQLENETDAIVVTGTTGENATLSDDEHLSVIKFTIDYINHSVPVIASTGSNNTGHAVSMSKDAQSMGADALLLVTPYYNKTSQSGLIRHFTTIGDHVQIPMILYNVPSRTGVSIQPETYLALSHHPNIYATKEASGDISLIAKTAALCGDDLAIYSGNDDQTLPILSLGGKGVISVLGNIMPKEMHDLCMYYFLGSIEESMHLQLQLMDLMDLMFCDVNPIPVKTAMSLMGICQKNCRLPLVDLNRKNKNQLKAVMLKHGLIQ
ncbi:MAG: 4-hydroxy-tetrahydrodipicolinate synthase [Candidatus Fimivivens sp.]